MRRPVLLTLGFALFVALAVQVMVSMPGSWGDALVAPFRTMLGTSQQLHARLLDVSETSESIRLASQRLLQPFGVVRLVQKYDISESEHSDKQIEP